MLAPVKALACPELGIQLIFKYIANLNKRLSQAELIVTNSQGKICVISGVGGVGLNQKFCFHPKFICIVIRVQPVINKDELRVCFRFIPQTVFRISSRSLKCDLLSVSAIQTVTGTKISVEFKTFH